MHLRRHGCYLSMFEKCSTEQDSNLRPPKRMGLAPSTLDHSAISATVSPPAQDLHIRTYDSSSGVPYIRLLVTCTQLSAHDLRSRTPPHPRVAFLVS